MIQHRWLGSDQRLPNLMLPWYLHFMKTNMKLTQITQATRTQRSQCRHSVMDKCCQIISHQGCVCYPSTALASRLCTELHQYQIYSMFHLEYYGKHSARRWVQCPTSYSHFRSPRPVWRMLKRKIAIHSKQKWTGWVAQTQTLKGPGGSRSC